MTATAIIDPFHPAIAQTIRESLPGDWTLTAAGEPTPKARAAAVAKAEIVFVMATPMPADLLQVAPKLKFIQKLGVGVDRIDTSYCAKNGIAVARLQAGNAIPVAEHTVMMILAACRRLVMLDRETRAGAWDKEASRGVNRHIHGKRIGIVGFGAIGRQVAQVLSGFGVEIAYFDPFPAPPEVEQQLRARRMELDEVVSTSDIVSLHLPLTDETRGLIGPERIARMKPDAILVNCARGGLVDETALAAALSEGRLLGAAIDTFSVEPPVGNPLLDLDTVTVSPHCAGATLDNFAAVMARAVENAQAHLAGQPLPPADVVV